MQRVPGKQDFTAAGEGLQLKVSTVLLEVFGLVPEFRLDRTLLAVCTGGDPQIARQEQHRGALHKPSFAVGLTSAFCATAGNVLAPSTALESKILRLRRCHAGAVIRSEE